MVKYFAIKEMFAGADSMLTIKGTLSVGNFLYNLSPFSSGSKQTRSFYRCIVNVGIKLAY